MELAGRTGAADHPPRRGRLAAIPFLLADGIDSAYHDRPAPDQVLCRVAPDPGCALCRESN